MHAVGRIFPRGDRAPSIEPVSERSLLRRIEAAPALAMFEPGRTKRISSGFYISQALEVLRT
jgi:magnesium-protoporphyrin O-methyltransferase